MKTIREKPHRLLRDRYQGRVSASFTLCLEDRAQLFVTMESVNLFIRYVRVASEETQVDTIYCFMPEHVHLLSMGTNEESDVLRSVERFKQTTGWWLKTHRPTIRWQKSFWDHIIQSPHEEAHCAWYLLNNPVRRGLVERWSDYPFTGTIGLDLKQYLIDLLPFT